MSYDAAVVLPMPADDPEGDVTLAELGNYTRNVSPMFRHALAPLHGVTVLGDLDGLPCATLAYSLPVAVARMESDREQLLPLQPANGWGDYAGALAYLQGLRDGCQRFAHVPGAVLRIDA